jgi:putative restriction endonuclease
MSLAQYIQKITHLRTDRSRGVAPHKPVLLLSVIDNIEQGIIKDNKVCITPELVATFMEMWGMLVKEGPFEPRFALPFFHLKSEGFWRLVPFLDMAPALTSSGSIRSFANLKETIMWTEIEPELFDLMSRSESREALRSALLDTYFPLTKDNYQSEKVYEGDYLKQLEQEVLESTMHTNMVAEEEELYLRTSAFRKAVPRAYGFTCAISGMRIIAAGISMVDSCHIIPFSQSHDDTIGNGIALCPNLHRAFDRHLITIDDDYRLQLKTDFAEAIESDYGIKKYEGRQLLLPADKKHWPLKMNLAWHREYR